MESVEIMRMLRCKAKWEWAVWVKLTQEEFESFCCCCRQIHMKKKINHHEHISTTLKTSWTHTLRLFRQLNTLLNRMWVRGWDITPHLTPHSPKAVRPSAQSPVAFSYLFFSMGWRKLLIESKRSFLKLSTAAHRAWKTHSSWKPLTQQSLWRNVCTTDGCGPRAGSPPD